MVTFTCQAVVSNVSWVVNGDRLDNSSSSDEFMVITRGIGARSTSSNLTTRAKANQNNTEIHCVAVSTGNVENRTAYIVVAGKY